MIRTLSLLGSDGGLWLTWPAYCSLDGWSEYVRLWKEGIRPNYCAGLTGPVSITPLVFRLQGRATWILCKNTKALHNVTFTLMLDLSYLCCVGRRLSCGWIHRGPFRSLGLVWSRRYG